MRAALPTAGDSHHNRLLGNPTLTPPQRAVLGGSTEDYQTSFLSRNANILVFQELHMKFVTFTMDSTFNWVRDARSLLIDDSVPRTEPSMDVLERAQFSLEVLDGSFFCLKTIEDETELVPATLAAIFLIDWEYRMAVAYNDALDDETA